MNPAKTGYIFVQSPRNYFHARKLQSHIPDSRVVCDAGYLFFLESVDAGYRSWTA
jgi:hypothetical protein